MKKRIFVVPESGFIACDRNDTIQTSEPVPTEKHSLLVGNNGEGTALTADLSALFN